MPPHPLIRLRYALKLCCTFTNNGAERGVNPLYSTTAPFQGIKKPQLSGFFYALGKTAINCCEAPRIRWGY